MKSAADRNRNSLSPFPFLLFPFPLFPFPFLLFPFHFSLSALYSIRYTFYPIPCTQYVIRNTLYLPLPLIIHINRHSILHIKRTQCTNNHEDSGENDCINCLVTIKVFHDWSAENTVKDLWEGDEEVENPHVNAHFTSRDRSCKNRVWHGKNGCPG